MMFNRYIHYGSDKFDKSRFCNIKNVEYDWTKPSGGLWASSVNSQYGWRQWCHDNDFWKGSTPTKYFEFDLAPDARVCHLRSINDLKELPARTAIVPSLYFLIDFEMAAKEYDAIELHLSEEVYDKSELGLYYKLYGWDCDSILIMNPNIIIGGNNDS